MFSIFHKISVIIPTAIYAKTPITEHSHIYRQKIKLPLMINTVVNIISLNLFFNRLFCEYNIL